MAEPVVSRQLERNGFRLGVQIRNDILHTDGTTNAHHDCLVAVVDGDEERRLGHIDVERSEYDLIVAVHTDRLLQSSQMTTTASVANHYWHAR